MARVRLTQTVDMESSGPERNCREERSKAVASQITDWDQSIQSLREVKVETKQSR
jgi:hypothetical protein